ncbi:ribosomal-protein-alanine acetyltransferase [Holospora elegans E1]|uniref:Ribosomal-protein-alanine acetyltransferase n=1 Tax=Holospora elegans E1 TaxID=1427503 RepID=A0A023E1A1_9PROT|nr:ribosomal-protein-alanine acetyltransferase [Holospora elegans E1]
MIKIKIITPDLAEGLCRKITADLPEYFGLPEVNEHYAVGVRSRLNLAACIGEEYVGLISIDFPYLENANIYWMGILRGYHRTGIGKLLSDEAFKQAKNKGAKTISVETLSPEETDENYLKTYHFYKSLGFAPLFNLKPQGYEWNMVYMLKSLDDLCENRTNDVLIRPLIREDIVVISEAFKAIGWNKPPSSFEEYLKEQEAGERLVWVAHVYDQFAAYVTLKWKSQYSSFKAKKIPEVMDLNVLPAYRKIGIGSLLLDTAEKEAATRSKVVGIGVGLYAGADGGYGPAQRLYIKRGYIPDGKGVTYNYQPAIPGNSYPLDDDLVLWFTKKLKQELKNEAKN